MQQSGSQGADVRGAAERLGYPRDARLLVVHADDLGLSHAIDEPTLACLEAGLVTSASVMVPGPRFTDLAARVRGRDDLDLGVHLTLTSEWRRCRWGPVSPRTAVPTLVDLRGRLPRDSGRVVKRARLDQVEAELRAQIERALDAGIAITHLDTHMVTLWLSSELTALFRRLGRDYELPVLVPRQVADHPGALIDRMLGLDAGVPAARWHTAYRALLSALPSGVYQLTLHLGRDDRELRAIMGRDADWGARWRQRDLELIRDPDFRRFLEGEGFIPVTWKQLRGAGPVS